MNTRPDIPKVKEVMTKKVKAISEDFAVTDALQFFHHLNVSSAPILNEQSIVIGFISDSDCLKCLANCLFFDDSKDNKKVVHIMQKDVVTLNEEDDLFEAESLFIAKGIKHAPVVNSNHQQWVILAEAIS